MTGRVGCLPESTGGRGLPEDRHAVPWSADPPGPCKDPEGQIREKHKPPRGPRTWPHCLPETLCLLWGRLLGLTTHSQGGWGGGWAPAGSGRGGHTVLVLGKATSPWGSPGLGRLRGAAGWKPWFLSHLVSRPCNSRNLWGPQGLVATQLPAVILTTLKINGENFKHLYSSI